MDKDFPSKNQEFPNFFPLNTKVVKVEETEWLPFPLSSKPTSTFHHSPIDHCSEVLSRSLVTDPTDFSITTDTFRSEVKKLSLLDTQDNMTPNYPIFTNCTIQCEYCFGWKCCFETPKLSKPLSQKEYFFFYRTCHFFYRLKTYFSTLFLSIVSSFERGSNVMGIFSHHFQCTCF